MCTDSSDNQSAAICTVVVCTKNRPAHLRRCLEQLQWQDFHSFEVLVVDNCAVPSEAFGIAASFGARYILCPRGGLSHARNAAITETLTEFIAFLDDDATPDPSWLCNLLKEFSFQKVAAVTGQIMMEGNGKTIPLFSEKHIHIDKDTPSWFEIANFGGIGGGSNMALRRKALGTWPGFNELLGRGQIINAWEDDHAFFTLIDLGFSIVHSPTARVHHPANTQQQDLHHSLHTIAVTSAYITLLALEYPRYLRQLFHFLLDAALRTPRPWKCRSRRPFDSSTSIWLVYSALIGGPFIYIYTRIINQFTVHPKAVTQSFDSQASTEH